MTERAKTPRGHEHAILQAVRKLAGDVHASFHQLNHRIGHIMATLAELQAAVDGVATVQKTESDNVAKIGTDVTAAIAAIQALPGSTGIDPAALDPIVSQLQALSVAAQVSSDNLAGSATSLEAVLPPKP